MRWLLLDEIISIEKKISAKTRSHVPEGPYSPALLMIEMMAQTGALLIGAENDYQEDLIFTKIESAEFEDVDTGKTLEISACSENLRPEGAWIDAQIQSKGHQVAEARFLLMNVGHFIPNVTQPITFHEQFMNYFKVREKIK